MKLRHRLSLLIGSIFCICFAVSILVDIEMINKYLESSSKRIQSHMLSTGDMSRFTLQNNLAEVLGKQQAQINALLLDLSQYPTNQSLWTNAVEIFQNNRWSADFIQVTNQEKSVVLMPMSKMKRAQEEPIDELLSWVIVEGHPLYLGAALPPEGGQKETRRMKLLFLPETLKGMKSTGIASVDRAIAFAQNPTKQPLKTSEMAKGSAGGIGERACLFQGIDLQVLNARFERKEEVAMLTRLIKLFPNPTFGDSPIASTAPVGIASFGDLADRALFSREIFTQEKLFQDTSYIEQNPPEKNCRGLSSGIAVIDLPKQEKIFVGNTIELSNKELVTVGGDFERVIMEKLLPGHQAAFVAYQGKTIVGYTSSGEKAQELELNPSMFRTPSGIITWANEPYYYLHMQPFKRINLRFYTLDLEKRAFADIHFQEASARQTIKKISYIMQLIALIGLALVLIVLYIFSRRLTKPITQLAEVTESVSSGQLEEISLPTISEKRRDEVAKLCNSFAKMVEDLKEKEAVKGILNKVVSKEIAQEILKGKVQLGGEERTATILFADIRHFTEMTTRLTPHEVIILLNTCMTKVSKIIDEYGGVIDKYLGDEVMALFGLPIEMEESALRAIRCALKMVEVLKDWNSEREARNEVRVEMGIGVHTGVVFAGNMGAESRLNYTVIGKNVNLASRLCSEAKGMQILISKTTLEEPKVKDHILIEELPPTELKGFEGKISVFQVIKEIVS